MLQRFISVSTAFRTYMIGGAVIAILVASNIYLLRKYDTQTRNVMQLELKYDMLSKHYQNTVRSFTLELEEERNKLDTAQKTLNEVRKVGKIDKCYNHPIGDDIYNKLYRKTKG